MRRSSASTRSRGALSFAAAPDFETKTDAGANGVYDVTVEVTDGVLTDTQQIVVTVIDDTGETLSGDGTANKLVGGIGDDSLSGLGGNDTLIGGIDNDTLDGGADNGLLDGGDDADTTLGGDGADTITGARTATCSTTTRPQRAATTSPTFCSAPRATRSILPTFSADLPVPTWISMTSASWRSLPPDRTRSSGSMPMAAPASSTRSSTSLPWTASVLLALPSIPW